MSTALQTLFTGRCPQCGEGRLFKGVLEMHPRCERCGAVFYRDPGSWTGATVLTYVGASAFAVVMLAALWATGRLREPGAEWIVLASVTAWVLLTLRPLKAFWVGLLYDWGYVYPDDAPPP